MAEDVGDLLDRCAVLQQPGRQRVPQRMHAMAAILTQPDTGHPGVLDQDLMQMILVGERPDRGGVPDEHLWAVGLWTAAADVVDERPADILEQRQLHPMPGLGLHHRQPVIGPVEIGELQPFDVDAAQPEPGDQHNDRVIPFAARVAPVDRSQDLGHLGPVPYRRDPGLPGRLHGRDRLQHNAVDQPVAGGEAQQRPYGAHFVLHRLDLVAGQGGHERADDPGIQAGQPTPSAGEREELPRHRAIGPHRRRGATGRLQPRLEPGTQRLPAEGSAHPYQGETDPRKRQEIRKLFASAAAE